MPGAILMVIKLDLHLLMINIFRKFSVDRMKTFLVIERKTHFYIKIKSSVFNNKSKLAMHKIVYDILKEEFEKGLHALELDLSEKK